MGDFAALVAPRAGWRRFDCGRHGTTEWPAHQHGRGRSCTAERHARHSPVAEPIRAGAGFTGRLGAVALGAAPGVLRSFITRISRHAPADRPRRRLWLRAML